MERSLRIAVLSLVAGQVPDDQGLVTAAREQHVGANQTVKCQQMILELDNRVFRDKMLGCVAYFSIEVAKLVTQPFCPTVRESPQVAVMQQKPE